MGKWGWWAAGGAVVGVGGFGAWWWAQQRNAGGAGTPGTVPGADPGMVGGTTYSPCDPMTMFCLLHHPVGACPVPDAEAWIPAQYAADAVWRSGLSLFTLTHHPVGAFGPALIPAQQAGDYLLRLGIDPCPPALYAALAAASQATGVPLPLLLSVAYTESTFLDYGQVPNSGCVPGACSVGQTGVPNGGPVGLMQVSAVAATQVGVPYADVVASYTSNALAGARYLAYLAGEYQMAPSSTDWAAWGAVLATAYGEGAAATSTISQATDPAWIASQTPANAQAAQAQRLTAAPAAPAAFVPAQVTCRTVTLLVNGNEVRVTACSNGTWTLVG